MALYIVDVKQMKICSGLWVERCKTLKVVINTIGNPVVTNGEKPVGNAFMRLYGIDLQNAGALSRAYMSVK